MTTLISQQQSHERAGADLTRISPSRITVARLRRGLTKSELAADLHITPATLSRWENEGPPPSRTESLLEQLETSLKFPSSYFVAPELEVPAMDSTLFRAGSRATQRQKRAAVASGANAKMLMTWLLNTRFQLSQTRSPEPLRIFACRSGQPCPRDLAARRQADPKLNSACRVHRNRRGGPSPSRIRCGRILNVGRRTAIHLPCPATHARGGEVRPCPRARPPCASQRSSTMRGPH